MEGETVDGFTPLRGAFGPSRKAFGEMAQWTLNLASRLPAYATAGAPSGLAAAFDAARKELIAVFAGASGRGKSALLNDLYRASKISAAEYAARTAEAAAVTGARLAVETYTPGPQEEWAPRAPKLELTDVHVGSEVEVYIACDNIWIPGHVLEVRTCGGVTEVRVDEYAQLLVDGEPAYDDAGAAMFGDELLNNPADTKIWRPLTCSGDDMPVGLGDGIALRHVRISRGDAAAEAPQLRHRKSAAPGPLDVVPAPDAELARYDGILPEGAVGHTTEVREQVLVHGAQLGVTIYFVPYAPTAAAYAKLHAALLEREQAPPSRRADFSAALAAMLSGDGAPAVASPPQKDEEAEAAEVMVRTVLTKREIELARAALGLPPGFNLAALTLRDVPSKLPREVAALLGRAQRFTPACSAGTDPQAEHEREVKRFLASHTRAKWVDAAATGGRPRLAWGNPYVSVIDRVVVTMPCDAVAAGRALVDTRGAEHAPVAELQASNDASQSPTAESLKAAGAAVLLVDARTDASAVLSAAQSSGIIKELAVRALAHFVATSHIERPPPTVRVALVLVADKEWREDSVAALRVGNRAAPTQTAAMAHLRQMEASVFATHKATLCEAIKARLLYSASNALDEQAAHACAVVAVQDVTCLAVYPRVALGHASSLSVAPPASAADAAALAETCGLVKLARFISNGDGPGPATRAAAAAAACMLRRGMAALSHELELHKQDPAELARLRAHAAAVAPDSDRFVLLNGGGGGGDPDGPLNLAAWKDELLEQLRTELEQMASTLSQSCTKAEFGRNVAALLGHPFAVGEAAVPPSEFDGVRAVAAEGPVSGLITRGELEGVQLYELLISPVVNWEESIAPDTASYGQPALPPVLALGWTKNAPTPVLAKAPCAEAQVWAKLLGSLGKLYSTLYKSAEKLAEDHQAGADDVARLLALLSAREAEFNISVSQLLDKFVTLNDALWWRVPEVAARTAGAAAAATLLERVRKGKQAILVPKSEHKTIKGTKLGTIESSLPRVAAAAATAFCDAAHGSLSGMVTALVADVRQLVQQHCDDLANVSDGSLRHLTRPRLWAALDTHIAAGELAARLSRLARPAGASDEHMLPERMLPRSFVAALYGKLKAMLPSGATLGNACDMKPGEHAAAMLAAAADVAQSSSAADAAAASALLARWRKPDEDPMRRAAWCRVTLCTLQLAVGHNASLRTCEPLRQLLCDVISEEPHTPPSGAAPAETWPDEQTYAMLGMCAKAGAQAGTAAFPLVRPELSGLDGKTREWLAQLTRLLSNERAAAGGGAASGGAASAAVTPSPAAPPIKSEAGEASTGTRKRLVDWVGTPVRKRFVADGTKRLEWFDGRVVRLMQSEESLWFRVRYSDGDGEDMTMEELKVAAADAQRAEAIAVPAPSAASWPPHSMGEVRRQIALLQLSAGGGPDTLASLRARFAPDRHLLLREEDGWVVARPVTKNGGIGDPQYLYYGDIGTDGKPTGMPPGRSIHTDAAATRVFSGKGAWLAVHHFRSGTPFVMPGAGTGSGGFAPSLPSAEAQRVRDAMTPRVVERDGVAFPNEAVKEHMGDRSLGTWRWEITTRVGGSTAGQIDKYFIAPDGTRMRSLNEVQRYLQSRSGRLCDDEEEEEFRAARRGKKRAAAATEGEAEGAGPSRQLPKRTAKDKTGSTGFYADDDD